MIDSSAAMSDASDKGGASAGLAPAGSFCWNQACRYYAKPDSGMIRKFGTTQKGTQRYQCRACKKTFTDTRGTVFYGKRHSPDTILECLALVAERCSLAAIHRIKGIKEETVSKWLEEAAQQVEAIETLLLARYPLQRVQLDALWTYVGNKGQKGATRKKTTGARSGAAPRSV